MSTTSRGDDTGRRLPTDDAGRPTAEQKQLSLQAVSERLAELGRPILPSGLSKIEQGDRRVDVDDLVALAAALETVPSALLVEPPQLDDEGASAEEYNATLGAAFDALKRCEAVGVSRYEVVEWPNQVDAATQRLTTALDALSRRRSEFGEALSEVARKGPPLTSEELWANAELLTGRRSKVADE
jgi:transcriptional regulator with XRE-family HTH domain